MKDCPENMGDGYSNENLKTAISLTIQELSPLVKASENRMPVENLMAYANEIGKFYISYNVLHCVFYMRILIKYILSLFKQTFLIIQEAMILIQSHSS